MIARLENGRLIPCPMRGRDGGGRMHTDLPLYYGKHPDKAAEDGYFPVDYTDKPDGDYAPSWEMADVEGTMKIVQTWTAYTPQTQPVDPLEEMGAKIDYLAMMTGVDFEEEVASDE